MRILALEPFFGGSHEKWLTQWTRNSRHHIDHLTLPARHWKWRMYGGAVTLARRYRDMPGDYDLLIASDMLDVATFKGLLPKKKKVPPIALYFHENQLNYPWSGADPDKASERANQYAFINYTSSLAADAVAFNSHFHRNAFLQALPPFLDQFPDHQEKDAVHDLSKKSKVLPLGLRLNDIFPERKNPQQNPIGTILWNHRWEYDKNPDLFLSWLQQLRSDQVPFQLVILGQSYEKQPSAFSMLKKIFIEEIQHIGYATHRSVYLEWLQKSDVLPVTSIQDFFGGSIVEAMAAGVYPILPHRLAYPEHIPLKNQPQHLYLSENAGYNMLKDALLRIQDIRKQKEHIRQWVLKYDWQIMADQYDQWVENT